MPLEGLPSNYKRYQVVYSVGGHAIVEVWVWAPSPTVARLVANEEFHTSVKRVDPEPATGKKRKPGLIP